MLQVANIILHPLIYQLIYLCIHSYSVLKIICPLGIPRALLRIMHLKHLCVPYLENGNKNHIKIIALRCHLQGVVYFLERGCSNLEFFFAVTEKLKSGEDDCHWERYACFMAKMMLNEKITKYSITFFGTWNYPLLYPQQAKPSESLIAYLAKKYTVLFIL